MQIVQYADGYLINASYPSCLDYIKGLEPFPLVLTDPPYGGVMNDYWDNEHAGQHAFADWLLMIVNTFDAITRPGASIYFWGSVGKHKNRSLFETLGRLESETPFTIKNFITWSKRRAYGVDHNYLFTREELVWLIKPASDWDGSEVVYADTFNTPYLDQLRTCRAFNPKYPCKSEYLRRTNVWTDVTEIFGKKLHSCQKPVRLYEIPILANTKPGDWVFDPFAGSGTCAEAAIKTGRKFVCIERDPEIFQIAKERIDAVYKGDTTEKPSLLAQMRARQLGKNL